MASINVSKILIISGLLLVSDSIYSNVIINEVLFDQTGGTSAADNDEFIELYNTALISVDISGYVLADGPISPNGRDGVNFTFPANTIIPEMAI